MKNKKIKMIKKAMKMKHKQNKKIKMGKKMNRGKKLKALIIYKSKMMINLELLFTQEPYIALLQHNTSNKRTLSQIE
jgi:hypothetical protein